MMTNSWAEVHPSPAAVAAVYSDWMLLEQAKAGRWTPQENKLFEEALAVYDKDTPDRWERVAEMTGKTARDVYSHYQDLEEDVRHIEEGLISFPGYDPPFTLDWENSPGYEGLKQAFCAAGGKRSAAAAAAAAAARPDHERKKGVPWTEEEHRLFLMGLKKYGKGDWRNISRNFVVSRTPTQVASHAQKYFIRLNSGSKDKRRSSIHDITTVNLPDNRSSLPSQQSGLSAQSNSSAATQGASDQFSAVVDSNQQCEAASIYSPAAHSITNQLMQQPYGMDSYRMKVQTHNLHRGAVHNSMVARHGMMFQMQAVQPHPHG